MQKNSNWNHFEIIKIHDCLVSFENELHHFTCVLTSAHTTLGDERVSNDCIDCLVMPMDFVERLKVDAKRTIVGT